MDPTLKALSLTSGNLKSIGWSPAYQGSAGNQSLPSIDKKIRNCKNIH